MSRLSTHTHMHTHRERIDVSMYSLLPKKETALALTHTHPPTDTDMHTPPTSYYTDGHILGFTIGSPHHETTTACAHSRLGSTCCSRLDCNSTQCVTVCCVLCPGFCVLRVFSMLCAPPQVCCATRSLNAVAAGRSSDTSSRPVTVDALVYRCLVSSSSPPKEERGIGPAPGVFPTQTLTAVSSPEVPVPSLPSAARLAAPVVAPRVTRASRHRDTVRLWRDLSPTLDRGIDAGMS